MKKAIYLLLGLFLLTGCLQSSAFVGPAITGASSGSIYNAGLSYTSNAVLKETTGKTAAEYLLSTLEEKKMLIEKKQNEIKANIEQKKILIEKKQKEIQANSEEFFHLVTDHISNYKKKITN